MRGGQVLGKRIGPGIYPHPADRAILTATARRDEPGMTVAPSLYRGAVLEVKQLEQVRWRTLLTPPWPGARNMALDEALMGYARESGEAVFRVYGWSRPTLSLGRNQTAKGRYDLERVNALGIDVVRRPTGGRAVLHAREVTYSVAAPEGALGQLRESYHLINRLLLDGLRALGIDAMEAEAVGVAPTPGILPCFEVPMAGEIVAQGRKLVGSAQVREHGALLQHGSILSGDDQALASSLLLKPIAPPPPPATLSDLLGRTPLLDEVATALFAGIANATPLSPSELDDATKMLQSRYEDSAWTWRR